MKRLAADAAASFKSSGRPRDERADRAITDAALRQLADVGYGRLSMESVSAEAGVARTTVYRRYRDKADLVTAAIAERASFRADPEESEDPRADLEEFLVELDGRFTRSCIEVLGALSANRDDRCAVALYRERVIAPRKAYARALLERAKDLGCLRADSDLDVALDMLVGAVVARTMSGQPAERGWTENALAVVWQGMGRPTGCAAGRKSRKR